MNRDKIKEEIAKMLDEIRDEYCLSDHESRLVYSDRILSLLDAQRCIWTGNNYKGFIKGCSGGYIYRMEPDYCEDCGRRIEVNDGQG